MPLVDLTPSTYIRRDREYIDSDQREENSEGEYDIVYRLSRRYQYVESIEVTDFNIPTNLSPTFIARDGVIPGNNLLDVRMESQVGPQVIEFTVELESGRYFNNTTDLANYVVDQINTTMDAQGDPFFSTTAVPPVEWIVDSSPGAVAGVLRFAVTRGGVQGDVYSYFMFGTGDNKNDSPARVLGFEALKDTIVIATFPNIPGLSPLVTGWQPQYGPVAPFIPQLLPFRYVDVFIEELEPSLQRRVPVARIFLYSDQPVGTRYAHSIMTTPRPRLST